MLRQLLFTPPPPPSSSLQSLLFFFGVCCRRCCFYLSCFFRYSPNTHIHFCFSFWIQILTFKCFSFGWLSSWNDERNGLYLFVLCVTMRSTVSIPFHCNIYRHTLTHSLTMRKHVQCVSDVFAVGLFFLRENNSVCLRILMYLLIGVLEYVCCDLVCGIIWWFYYCPCLCAAFYSYYVYYYFLFFFFLCCFALFAVPFN